MLLRRFIFICCIFLIGSSSWNIKKLFVDYSYIYVLGFTRAKKFKIMNSSIDTSIRNSIFIISLKWAISNHKPRFRNLHFIWAIFAWKSDYSVILGVTLIWMDRWFFRFVADRCEIYCGKAFPAL